MYPLSVELFTISLFIGRVIFPYQPLNAMCITNVYVI